MRNTLLALGLVLSLCACESNMQSSSGEDYLVRHAVSTLANTPGQSKDMKPTIEQRLREAAAVEPTLSFPARIGIARLERGQLSDIPNAEGAAWAEFVEQQGKDYGEFVPLSLLVAGMFSGLADETAQSWTSESARLMNRIRLAAARQHLDAVLIYEVRSKQDKNDNLLALGKLTVIGGFLLPSKTSEAEGFATGLLIDVMQAYPYANMLAFADKETELSSAWGWGSDSYGKELVEKIEATAVRNLAQETGKTLAKLRPQLAAAQAKIAADKQAKAAADRKIPVRR